MDENVEKMPDALLNALNKAVPTKLDEIITKRREEARLYLTTNSELQGLQKPISPMAPVKDEIDDWRFVTFDTKSGGAQVTLLGHAKSRGIPWITSQVFAIDFGEGLVMTENSYYLLVGTQGVGEPPPPHLLHVCFALHYWGLGKRLGVLEVFY